jgi:hypothetical protein
VCHASSRAERRATVVDHITPHKLKDAITSGDRAAIALAQKLFWDTDNWQSLCKQHHDSTKQRMEKRGVVIGCDENGNPLDPNSHWMKPSGQVSSENGYQMGGGG